MVILLLSGACGVRPAQDAGAPTFLPAAPTTPAADLAPSPRLDSQRARMAAEIDAYVTRLAADGSFSGVVLAAYDGELVLERGYGWADHERHIPNSPATRFRISSLTKAFTAAAILILQQQGRLRVDDPICAYLEGCPPAWGSVTIHQLLTHTSGIPDYTLDQHFWEVIATRQIAADELTARIAAQPQLADPGARFAYSSSGYVLLGMIIARVTSPDLPAELAYAGFLKTAIFAPLHMEETGSDTCETEATALAVGYASPGIRALPCDPTAFFAMGNLSSTARDLARWALTQDSAALLAAPARTAIVKPYVATGGYGTAYGYGWYITTIGEMRGIWHDGATPGYRSYLLRRLDERSLVIILSNTEVSPVVAMGREINAIMIRRASG